MIANVRIKRSSGFAAYQVECDDDTTVAMLLDNINMNETDPIEWECSCRQNMCGSCAMVINKIPALACASFVRDLGTDIQLEPLSKFPLIKDLKVDRSSIHRMLERLESYHNGDGDADFREHERQYLSASCLMCGLCMEVCPNYTGKNDFGSALAANAMYKTVSQEPDSGRARRLSKTYRKTQFSKCSNSLSCTDVCPLNLPQASTISRINRKMLKRLFR